jgi:perosamine synthetase
MIPLFNINDYVVDTSKFDHSLHGSVVQELEETIADYVGAKYACSISSATNAIFLSFLNKQLTVSVPSMIPPVVLNALINSGNQIKFTDNTEWVGDSYILHDFGDYKVIDSAQKIMRGQFDKEANPNDLMFFSFYPTKPIGGLDGCVIVSDDFDKIQWFREATMNGMGVETNSWERGIKFPGWKMYMNSFQAHIALQNFFKLEKKKERLKEIRENYNEAFNLNNTSEHLYRIDVDDREKVMSKLNDSGVSCGIHYSAMHLHPLYKLDSVELVDTEQKEKTTLSIPYNEKLNDDELNWVVKCLRF